MTRFCDLHQWETNEPVYRIGNDDLCFTCVNAMLPSTMEDLFGLMGAFLPDGFSITREMARAA